MRRIVATLASVIVAMLAGGGAHPPAIAWRVVLKYLVNGLTHAQICEHLAPMSLGSVHNIL